MKQLMIRVLLSVLLPVVLQIVGLARVNATEVTTRETSRGANLTIDFSDSAGVSIDHWLGAKGFKFEQDARDRRLLELSVANDALVLKAKGRLRGFLLNDSVDLDAAKTVRIEWGIIQYPKGASYARKVNNEALMVYVFFGRERIPSGNILIPNSPYFIGLFLCDDEQVDVPYKGRYFHIGGRFVCLGKPKPNNTIVSEFNLGAAFKHYFDKDKLPNITGFGLGVDTSSAGDDGRAGAFIRRIEFVK